MALLLAFMVFILGIIGVYRSVNIVKTILFLNVTQAAVIIIFLLISTRFGIGIPIIGDYEFLPFVDPMAQALMITAIVIGAGITSLALMLAIKLFHFYGTLSWQEIFEREK